MREFNKKRRKKEKEKKKRLPVSSQCQIKSFGQQCKQVLAVFRVEILIKMSRCISILNSSPTTTSQQQIIIQQWVFPERKKSKSVTNLFGIPF